jgi:hypothetical protein
MAWTVLLGIGALLTLFLAWPVGRARYWVALISAGYFIPTLWWVSLGGAHLFILNILVDASICLVIDRYAKEKWEVSLFRVYKLSAATSACFFGLYIVVKLANGPSTIGGIFFETYAILLEAFSWTALAIIARTGWIEWNGRLSSVFHRRPHSQTARAAIRAPRTSHSWQRR